MSFDDLLKEMFSTGVIAPLISLVVLPIIYRIVGVTKRERREQEQMALRMTMDLARGLKELAEATSDVKARSEYQAMRGHVLKDFLERAKDHFDEERMLIEHPEARYWLVPRPRGVFGFIWAAITIVLSGLFMMALVGVVAAAISDPPNAQVIFGLVLIFLFLFVGPILLFRWLAFVSARMAGAANKRRRQSQSQSRG